MPRLLLILPLLFTSLYAQSQERLIDDFDGSNGLQHWSFSNGAEFPGASGTLSLGPGHQGWGAVLTYRFTCLDKAHCGHYVAAIWKALSPLDANPAMALSLWVRLSLDVQLTVRVTDQTGQTLQFHANAPMLEQRTAGECLYRSKRSSKGFRPLAWLLSWLAIRGFSGAPRFIFALALTPGRCRGTIDDLQRLMRSEGEIANLILRALIWRRIGLASQTKAEVTLIGYEGRGRNPQAATLPLAQRLSAAPTPDHSAAPTAIQLYGQPPNDVPRAVLRHRAIRASTEDTSGPHTESAVAWSAATSTHRMGGGLRRSMCDIFLLLCWAAISIARRARSVARARFFRFQRRPTAA